MLDQEGKLKEARESQFRTPSFLLGNFPVFGCEERTVSKERHS